VIDLSDVSCTVDYESTVTPFDIDRAVSDLAELREIRKGLADWEAELSEWLAEALGYNTLTLDSGHTVQVRRSTDRKAWDHDALIRLVIARGRDERRVTEDGEYESEGEAVGRALMECARPSWRVTALRERGIDPDEYAETSPGKIGVVIT
jgi:hypothetical protein